MKINSAKKIVAALTFLQFILFYTPKVTAQTEKFEKAFYTSSENFSLNYRILYPKDYQKDKSYPLVLFLHGAGERGDDNEAQLKHGVALFASEDSQARFPCIVVAPQCPKDSYWASVEVIRDKYPVTLNFDYSKPSTPPLNAAIELVKKMIKDKVAAKKQVYIVGLSMGGMGTFEAVYKHPKLFDAAMPICGGGDEEKFTKKMAKLPYWVFHGDVDGVVSVENSREAVAKLKELGANVKYTEYPGVNHNSWDNAFVEPDFLNWLFAQ